MTGKAIIGNVTEQNRNVLIFPSTLSPLDNKPYYEASVGVENIFKVFRIDALWRMSYTDKKYVSDYVKKSGGKHIPRFGVMWSLQVTF